jgi:hypothetical protein
MTRETHLSCDAQFTPASCGFPGAQAAAGRRVRVDEVATTADACTEDAAVLLVLAEVSVQAALLLDEARKRYAMQKSERSE